MNEFLLEHQEIISVYTNIATMLIPFVIAGLGWYSERKKQAREDARIEKEKKEQQRKEELALLKEYINKNIVPVATQLRELQQNQKEIRKRDIETVTIPMYDIKKYAFHTLYYKQIKVFANMMIHIIDLGYFVSTSSIFYLIAQWFENLEKMLVSKSFYQSKLQEIVQHESTLIHCFDEYMEEQGVKSRTKSMFNRDLPFNELNEEGIIV